MAAEWNAHHDNLCGIVKKASGLLQDIISFDSTNLSVSQLERSTSPSLLTSKVVEIISDLSKLSIQAKMFHKETKNREGKLIRCIEDFQAQCKEQQKEIEELQSIIAENEKERKHVGCDTADFENQILSDYVSWFP
jgi:hypothetical protein